MWRRYLIDNMLFVLVLLAEPLRGDRPRRRPRGAAPSRSTG